jgi:tetratricopeptide (TPR) repeat protein
MTAARLLAALLLLAVASRADAAGKGDEKAARTHFEAGEKAFKAGDFQAAITSYQAAYDAKPLPGFLFNIAQCHRHMGNHEQAVTFYRRYLALNPETPNRAVVEDLIAEEQKKKDAAPPAATAPPAVALAPPPASIAPPPAVMAPPAAVPPPPPPPPAPPPVEQPVVHDTKPVLPAVPDAKPALPATPASDEPPLFVQARRPEAEPAPVYKRWWFWTAVGGAVAAGVVAALVLKGAPSSSGPSAKLAPIDWR